MAYTTVAPTSNGTATPRTAIASPAARRASSSLLSLPLVPMPCWVPTTAAARTSALTLKVSDLTFTPAPDVPCYMEPVPDTIKLAAFGRMDLRACHGHTMTPLVTGTVLKDERGDYWTAENPSDVWPPPRYCVTLMRHLVTVPAGIAS